MNDESHSTPPRAARIAWIVLLFLSTAYTVNHLAGVVTFAEDDIERLMFVVFAALNLVTVIALLIPYRSGDPWAWGITWVSVAVFAICPLLVAPPIGYFYLGSAVVMAVAQLVARPDFRRARKRGGAPDR